MLPLTTGYFVVHMVCLTICVDVIGVVKSCGDLGRIVGKQSQKEIMKRELSIVDQSGVAINLTLWGNEVC